MTEYRNIKANGERSGMNGSRYHDVPTPARTDGVGVALRRAFGIDRAGDGDGIEDFQSLLSEIDRRS